MKGNEGAKETFLKGQWTCLENQPEQGPMRGPIRAGLASSAHKCAYSECAHARALNANALVSSGFKVCSKERLLSTRLPVGIALFSGTHASSGAEDALHALDPLPAHGALRAMLRGAPRRRAYEEKARGFKKGLLILADAHSIASFSVGVELGRGRWARACRQ